MSRHTPNTTLNLALVPSNWAAEFAKKKHLDDEKVERIAQRKLDIERQRASAEGTANVYLDANILP